MDQLLRELGSTRAAGRPDLGSVLDSAGPLLVVVDDCDPSAPQLGTLQEVLGAPGVRWLLASRRALPLPGEPDLVLTAAQLALDRDEFQRLVASWVPGRDPQELAPLLEVTEGWVRGLEYLARAPAGEAGLEVAARSIEEYFSSETYQVWPENLRRAARDLAVLPALSSPACAVLAPEGTREELERAGAYLVTDRTTGQPRFHQLFRAFLLVQLEQEMGTRYRRELEAVVGQDGPEQELHQLARRALSFYRTLGNRAGQARALWVLAGHQAGARRLNQAAELYQAAAKLEMELDNPERAARAWVRAGEALQQAGHAGAARPVLTRARETGQAAGGRAAVEALMALARLNQYEGNPAAAKEHWQAALALAGTYADLAAAIAKELETPPQPEPPGPAVTPPAVVPLDVRVLGEFSVRRGGTLMEEAGWRRPRVKSLFLYLVLQAGSWVDKRQLFLDFWGHLDQVRAGRSFRVTLHALRRALQPGLMDGTASAYVDHRERYCRLLLGGGSLDLHQFELELRAARGAEQAGQLAPALEHYRRASAVYAPLAPDEPPEPWLAREQARLRDLYVSALVGLARMARELGQAGEALEAARRAMELAPEQPGVHLLWASLTGAPPGA